MPDIDFIHAAVNDFETICHVDMASQLKDTTPITDIGQLLQTVDSEAAQVSLWRKYKTSLKGSLIDFLDLVQPLVLTPLPLGHSTQPSPRDVLFAVLKVLLANPPNASQYKRQLKSIKDLLPKLSEELSALSGIETYGDHAFPVLSELFRTVVSIFAYVRLPPKLLYGPLEPRGALDQPEIKQQLHQLHQLVEDIEWISDDFSQVFQSKWGKKEAGIPCTPSDFVEKTLVLVANELAEIKGKDTEGHRFKSSISALILVLGRMLSSISEKTDNTSQPSSIVCGRIVGLLALTRRRKASFQLVANVVLAITDHLSIFEQQDNPNDHILIMIGRSLIQTNELLSLLGIVVQDESTHLKVLHRLRIQEKISLNHPKLTQKLDDLRTLTASVKITMGPSTTSLLPNPSLDAIWKRAIEKYRKETSFDLLTSANLTKICSIEDLIEEVRRGELDFKRNRAKGGEIRALTTPLLSALSQFVGALGEDVQQVFPGGKAVAGSVKVLLEACRNVSASNEMILQLFRDLSAFLQRIRWHRKGATHQALRELFVEILCQFIIVMGCTYKTVKQGKVRRILSFASGMPDEVVQEAQEFRRLCSVLDSLLLTLIFENTLAPSEDPAQQPSYRMTFPSIQSPMVPLRGTVVEFSPVVQHGNNHPPRKGLSLLSLDGGGVHGLTELFILKEILHRVQYSLDREDELLPCQIFDVIAGTGTGGLIALFLGRLRMPISQAIKEYITIFRAVYAKSDGDNPSDGDVQKKTRRFETKVKEVIDRASKSQNVLMQAHGADLSCKTFVCATPADSAGFPRLFRNYSVRRNPAANCTVWEAARATTAFPEVFSDIRIEDTDGIPERFVGGGLRWNNPINVLKTEVSSLSQDSVSCLISLGAGHPGVISYDNPSGLAKVVLKIAEDCEAAADKAEEDFSSPRQYYWRFNVEQGFQNWTLEEWERLGEMKAHVTAYLQKADVGRQITNLTQVLMEKMSLEDTCLR